MDTSINEPEDELRELHRKLQKGLDDMLVFNTYLSRFGKRTLELFIALTSDRTKFEETIERLEELENKLSQGHWP